MAYDIPQNLKYKEIFAYGMTLRQFIYVTVFGVASVMIVSQPMIPQEVGAVAALLLMGSAVLLGFFDLDRKLLEFIDFLNQPRDITFLSKEASKFLGVKYIKDSAIVLKDNTIVGVLRVDAINFSILSQEQREAVIHNFMNFLNSLGFRIQLIMRTVSLDMNQYLATMEEKVSVHAEGGLAETYSLRDFLEKYVNEHRVTDRVFFITVPLKPTTNTMGPKKEPLRVRELEERLEVIREWLSKSMLDSSRLDNHGILAFLASFFSGDVRLADGAIAPYTTHGGENDV